MRTIFKITPINFILIVLLLISWQSKAQYNVSTPYSRYGIGILSGNSSQVCSAMGGIGYAYSTDNEINLINPASLFGVDTQSFVFNIGFNMNWRNLKSKNESSHAYLSDITSISFAFPILNRLKVGLSLLPVSDIKYQATDTVLGQTNYAKLFEGDGGIDKFTFTLSYQIIKSQKDNLAVGANCSYYFGNINRQTSLEFLCSEPNNLGTYYDTIGFVNSATRTGYNVSSFGFDFGAQYFHKLQNGNVLGFGATFSPTYKLSCDKKQLFYTYYRSAGITYLMDTITNYEGDCDIKMPMSLGFGFSFERPNKIFVETDFKYQNWSDFYFDDKTNNQGLKDCFQIGLGTEYIPDYASLKYVNKLAYRFGVNYNNGYIFLRDKRIDQIGISLGLGLPIKKLGTRININFECGKIGTKDNSLIKETYIRLGLSVSAKDRWFVKRKYR